MDLDFDNEKATCDKCELEKDCLVIYVEEDYTGDDGTNQSNSLIINICNDCLKLGLKEKI